MFTLYALLLVGVCAVLLGLMLEAVISVSRKPKWGEPRQKLALVEVEDRRHHHLPYVGAERRAAVSSESAPEHRRAA